MNTVMNKISAVALGSIFAFSATLAPTANAGALEDQIAALLAQIAALQAQMNNSGSTTTVTTGATKTYVYSRLLKVGKRGNDVKELQSCLNRLGNNTGVVDGIFGPNTKAGVMSFQAEKGLVVDGIIGPQTGPKFEEACMVGGTTTTPPTETGVTGDKLVVSGLASDDMLIGEGQTVVFSKITLEAGDEDVMAKKFYVEKTGSADRDVIERVVLLDSAMLELDRDNIDSDDEAQLKADIEVRAGKTKTVYLAAVLKDDGVSGTTHADIIANDGLEVSLKVTNVTTDGADVEGTPIMGATHTVKDNVSVDTFKANLTVDETGNVRIGEENVEVATINVENNATASNDSQTVKSIQITRMGDASDDALDNVEIKVAGKTYSADQNDDEYTFDFGDGIELAENGDDEDFVVRVDVEDDANRTFSFYLSDIVVLDEDGILLSEDDKTDADTEAGNVTAIVGTANSIYDNWEDDGLATIDLSDVRISKTSDVQSHKVAAAQDQAELASFDVEVTGKDVEGDLQITLVVSGVDVEDADGVASTATNAVSPDDVDIDNITVYTADGDKVSDREDTSFSILPTDGAADQMTYVVTIDGVKFEEDDDPIDYVIKGDINKDAPDGTRYEVTQIKYVSIEDKDGENIADVTETIASPAQIDVEGAVIAVSVEDADDQDLNIETDDVEVAQIKLDADNSGDDIEVTRVKLQFAAVTSADLNGDGNVNSADYALALDEVTNCELFDGNNSVSNTEDADSSVTFNLDDVVVTKDTEKTLSVRCDVGDDLVNNDTVTVTGLSFDAEGVITGTSLDDNSGFGNTIATVTTGSTTFKLSTDDANDDKVVKDDANDVVLGVYEFKAKDAELTLDDITVTFISNVSTYIDGKVKIDIVGDTSTDDSETPTNVNPSLVTFTNLAHTVAKDETVTITISADIDTAAAGNSLQIDTVTVTTEEGVNATDPAATEALVNVVAGLPIVTKINVDSNNLETSSDVKLFAYSVKADGSDIVLGNTVFDVDVTNVTFANAQVKVYDNASMTGSSEFEIDVNSGNITADNQFDIDLSSVTIPDSDTYYVFLVGDPTTSADTRSVRVVVKDVTYATSVAGMSFTDVDDATVGNQSLDAVLLLQDDMKSLLKKD